MKKKQKILNNRFGLDADYHFRKLAIILRDIENYTPDEYARSLARLVRVADASVLREPEFENIFRGINTKTTPLLSAR